MGTYTQNQRKFRVETPLGADALLLERFEGEEAISTPYLFTLHMASEDAEIDPAALLRQPAAVVLELPDGSERVIHGLVRRFVQLERTGMLTRYRAELVPWCWFLSLSSDCRIFQEMSVPDIVAQLFGDLGFSDFENRCTGSYAAREYCVQYRETHLDFVSRLLEEEGIFYFFEHTSDKHVLVLADATSAIKPCPGQAIARLVEQAGPWQGEDVITGVEVETLARTGKVVLTDYNYLTPSSSLQASSAGDAPEEHYDYPGNYGVRDDGERYSRLELESREVAGRVLRGAGTCRAFQPGYRFALHDHYRRDLNANYQLLRVSHEGRGGGFDSAQGADDEDYRGSFAAIPYTVPFRPSRVTPRPVVHGSQTAVVVGKSGEEIWVDKHGRVKVQFHWDRLGKKDEKSSCWVRVSSSWAGKGWGFIQIPRIGQEVIVDFLEGNPDRPIITGRVYNAEQVLPYALPDNQTQSGVKSRSSKAGGTDDFNEFRFEDKKGEEQIYLHAQKNWATMVENDRTLDVGNDETITVVNNRSKSVGNDETVDVGSNRTETVGQDESITIGAKRTESVGTDERVDVGAKRAVSIGTSDELTVGTTLTIDAGQKISATAPQEVSITVGGSSITLTPTGIEIVSGGNHVKLGPSGVEVVGAPNVKVQAAAQVDVQGAMVGITGAMVKIN